MSETKFYYEKKKNLFFALLLMLCLSSCAGIPFDPVQLSSVKDLYPKTVAENFEAKLPEKFSVIESVEIHYGGHRITALGYTEACENENRISLASLTPEGIKLFQIQFENGKIHQFFSLPKAMKRIDPEKTAEVIAEDIQRIYFCRTPAGNSVSMEGRIKFTKYEGKGTLVFFFGGPYLGLIEKKYSEGDKVLWRVRYFDYETKNSKLYPSKIFYENFSRRYKLILRLKEILE